MMRGFRVEITFGFFKIWKGLGRRKRNQQGKRWLSGKENVVVDAFKINNNNKRQGYFKVQTKRERNVAETNICPLTPFFCTFLWFWFFSSQPMCFPCLCPPPGQGAWHPPAPDGNLELGLPWTRPT